MRMLDVRHEQTAVFAAEAVGKLTRVPGLAVLTAGPGVTNGVSAITQAQFSGSPLVVVGGRAPANRWGMGSLQELDHPPLLAPVTKSARTVHQVGEIAGACDEAFTLAGSSHRGPTFLDVPMDQFFDKASVERPAVGPAAAARRPTRTRSRTVGALLAGASRPVLVLGTDVWADGAEEAALRFVEETGVPVVTNGMGRGVVPGGHPLLVTKARGAGVRHAPTSSSWSARRWTSGSATASSAARTAPPAAQVVHLADSPGQVSRHAELAASASGDLTSVLDGVQAALERSPASRTGRPGSATCRPPSPAAVERDARAAARPRPTRSTRPASTASWCPGWPTTRW